MRLHVDVTQADIVKARLLSPNHIPSCFCPVALALRRASKRAVWVESAYVRIAPPMIDVEDVPWYGFDQDPTTPLPIEARQFIDLYDRDLPVVPFAFDLDIPEEE